MTILNNGAILIHIKSVPHNERSHGYDFFSPQKTSVSYPIAALNPAYEIITNKSHTDAYAPIPSDTKENQLCALEPATLKQCFGKTLEALDKAVAFIQEQDVHEPDRIDYINYVTGYFVYNPNVSVLEEFMDRYKYEGIELTPNIFAELLIQFFDGKQFKRQTAIDIIVSFHKENGGLTAKNEYVSVFKKACQRLLKNGLINVGYGTWRLNYKVPEIEIVKDSIKEEIEYTADKIIGEGENAVYVYYYDAYMKLAKTKGEDSWECKVGRTDREPLQRVLGQAGTCYPEFPHIALLLLCDNSSILEAALHNALKLRGKHIENAPGSEWFNTTPKEVEDLYIALMNRK